MNYEQTKYFKYCQDYIDLPLRDYSGQIWLVDELQKTAVDCNKGFFIHTEYD